MVLPPLPPLPLVAAGEITGTVRVSLPGGSGDLVLGKAQPFFPSVTGPWNFALSPGGATAPYYQWRLPAQLIFSSATDLNHQHLRLGLAAPVDANNYWYPQSQGVLAAPNYRAPDFYTNNNGAAANQRPKVDYTYGQKAITWPILSPPAIAYAGANRYVYVVNSNAVWRYDVTSPAAFIKTNGATNVFTRTRQSRGVVNGTLYNPTAAFQFNSTAPFVNFQNQVYAVDIVATSPVLYSYGVSKLDGGLAPATTNMWTNTSYQLATGVAGTTADNTGIYMVSGDGSLTTAYMGLSNGRVYYVDLN